jgi:hypothetical protein
MKGSFYMLKDVELTDPFFLRYKNTISDKTIFEQGDILCDKT